MKKTLVITIGLLLAAGIFAILTLNGSVSSVASASTADAVGTPNSPPLNANALDAQAKHGSLMTGKQAAIANSATRRATRANREAAAMRRAASGMTITAPALVTDPTTGALIPDLFGMTPNFANSPQPQLDALGNVIPGTGIRKFVDSLPGLGTAGANNLGNYIPVAIPNTTMYPGSDYYEIELGQYTEQLHSDLPATTLRGYRQTNTADPTVSKFSYLGPLIIAKKDIPVRVKFTNNLSTGAGGNLFLPVDTTVMGAGEFDINWNTTTKLPGPNLMGNFTQNRATLHLHGGNTPWISDGTEHQWITPAGEGTLYPRGVSVMNVPDMADPGPGSQTFYYTNQQSARLMFYHDHAYGITRLNVYAGEAAGYLETDSVEQGLIASGILPDVGIPLIIQDKTFVDNTTINAMDPTWLNASGKANWGSNSTGDLWFPHVYMPNQNPYDITGANPMGRWDYGPWFWPPVMPPYIINGPIPNPYYDPVNASWEPPFMPGTPDARGISPTIVPEAFMDTPMVNGAVYPNLTVEPKAYRFRILNAGNDRMLNLQLYVASPIVSSINVTSGGSGYTSVPAVTITDSTGIGATAAATIDTNVSSPTFGNVTAVTIMTVGSNYTAPTVTIAPPTTVGGTTATATAMVYSIPTEVGMVPAAASCGPVFPAGWPAPDGRDGGLPDPAMAGPSMIQIGTEGGFLPAPYEVPNRPVGYEYNRRSITVLNVQEKALWLGPAERADVIVDFSAFAGKTLILYNDAPAPVPAFDPRFDYYTGDPNQVDTGGAPSTLPGYGPNTRTIMQIKVVGTPSTPFNLSNLTAALPQAYNASQDKPIVGQDAYNAPFTAFSTNYPTNVSQYVRIQDHTMTFTPGDSTVATPRTVTMELEPKAIVEDFDFGYGRMNAMLGTEVPLTGPQVQTTLPYFDIDPPTELINNTNASALIGTLGDGTQLWKVTHNGVDTHAIHFHMFNVQLVNRVGWDGAIKPPAPNELGWKDTVIMNPLEDIVVALRPIIPNVPFGLPNEIRPLDVTAKVGTSVPLLQFHDVDPSNEPAPVINEMVNFGWEYVWHCHLLGHEENIMMRPIIVAVAPNAPVNLIGISGAPGGKRLNWTDNSTNELSFTVQTNASGVWTDVPSTGAQPNPVVIKPGAGPTTGTTYTFRITGAGAGSVRYYRVVANNVVGYTRAYLPPAMGYPHESVNSQPSNIAQI